jgi:hypothetical protein
LPQQYGWIEDPEPWPLRAEFPYGAVVIAPHGALSGMELVVTDYDDSGTEDIYGVITRDEQRDGWSFPESLLKPTGELDLAFAGPRARPVLGDGTLVRMRFTDRMLDLGIVGELGETRGLWLTDDSRIPRGYTVWVFAQESVFTLGWEDFEPILGNSG